MSKRSGSKNRQRQKQVAVRLSDEEHALVIVAAKRQGVSAASVLRCTFLAEYTAENESAQATPTGENEGS